MGLGVKRDAAALELRSISLDELLPLCLQPLLSGFMFAYSSSWSAYNENEEEDEENILTDDAEVYNNP